MRPGGQDSVVRALSLRMYGLAQRCSSWCWNVPGTICPAVSCVFWAFLSRPPKPPMTRRSAMSHACRALGWTFAIPVRRWSHDPAPRSLEVRRRIESTRRSVASACENLPSAYRPPWSSRPCPLRRLGRTRAHDHPPGMTTSIFVPSRMKAVLVRPIIGSACFGRHRRVWVIGAAEVTVRPDDELMVDAG